MEYEVLLKEYETTEKNLRERLAALKQSEEELPCDERDDIRRRIAVMQEELYDVTLVRLELAHRHSEEVEEGEVAAAC